MTRDELIDLLLTEELSNEAHKTIVADFDASLPLLLNALQDETLSGAEARGQGWVRLHAVRLLCGMRMSAAVEPMLHLLTNLPEDSDLARAMADELPLFGSMLVEPTLNALAGTAAVHQDSLRILFSQMLTQSAVRDERIYAQLLILLEQSPAAGAELLASYGDTRAIEPLTQKFDELAVELAQAPGAALEDVMSVVMSLKDLAGELSERQQAIGTEAVELYARTDVEWGQPQAAAANETAIAGVSTRRSGLAPQKLDAHVHGPHCDHAHVTPRTRVREKLGRNEPCWCGSGKKYKKCHEGSDETKLYA